ncbi:MAG: sortase [Propionibacteriaceae bacterium]|nr:sortase [Propionibacteriaceae bacterium]
MATGDNQAAPSARRARRRMSWGWLVVVLVAVVLAVVGVVAVLVSNVIATRGYESRVAAGDDVAVLTVPRFGSTYAVPILGGTDGEQLRQGVGWYDGTAAPGELGNFALTGYRFGWGQPFARVDDLRVGDKVIVEAGAKTYTYSIVTGPTVVSATDVSVLAPVPGDIDRAASTSLITLTTSAHILPSPQRVVVVGELTAES